MSDYLLVVAQQSSDFLKQRRRYETMLKHGQGHAVVGVCRMAPSAGRPGGLQEEEIKDQKTNLQI